MRVLIGTLAVLLALTFTAAAGQKVDAKKLVGVWKLAEAKEKFPGDMTLEFTKDMKLKLKIMSDKFDFTIDGTYEVKDNNKLHMTMKDTIKGESKTEILTITNLTDTDLTIEDKKGDATKFKRK